MIPAYTFMLEFLPPVVIPPVVISVARDRVRLNRLAVSPRVYHGMIAEQAQSRSAVYPPSPLRGRCPQLAPDFMGATHSAERKLLNAQRLRVAT